MTNEKKAELLEQLRNAAKENLDGCRIEIEGLRAFTPDGVGNYRGLWTRDFSYMAEYAGDLISKEDLIQNTELLLSHANPKDGWMPDFVGNKITIYCAGSGKCGLPNLDNSPFAMFLTDECLRRMDEEEGHAFFLKWQSLLWQSLYSIPKDANGLVYNDPEKVHSPYGFTDCIAKTGSLMMESLLYWRACRRMEAWENHFGRFSGRSKAAAEAIERALPETFATDGLLLAATEDCRQGDVWGSAYAVAIGFPLPDSIRNSILQYLVSHKAELVQNGQLRHLPAGEDWQRFTLAEQYHDEVKSGTYQNGAFWFTPMPWYLYCENLVSPAAALETLQEGASYLLEKGAFECTNGSYTKVNHYVASATNLYGAAKALLK